MTTHHNKLTSSKGQLSTTITSLSHDGRGVAAQSDGKTLFISGALPGETVSYHLSKKHTRYSEGYAVDIENPAPERTEPVCPHYGICGGCSMQHIALATQIELKQKTLLEQLKHFGKVVPEIVLPPLTGSPLGYRHKSRLSVFSHPKTGMIQLGYREKASQKIADIQSCAVLHPSIGQHIVAIKTLVESLSQRANMPQIEVAISDSVAALVFRHVTDLPAADIEKLRAFAAEKQIHIYTQPNAPAALQKIWPEDGNDKLSYTLPDFQLDMRFHPLDFTQINTEVNALMVKQALQLLDPQATDTVLDLFCGLGNFTLPLARSAKHVIGIEGNQAMVTRAKDNATHNHISNTEFHVGNLSIIPAMQPTWMKQSYDKILLDPPRTGAEEILECFPTFNAKKIVYVSCNPATLARDAGILVHQQGYRLQKAGVINMFPHTSHIEAMLLFEK